MTRRSLVHSVQLLDAMRASVEQLAVLRAQLAGEQYARARGVAGARDVSAVLRATDSVPKIVSQAHAAIGRATASARRLRAIDLARGILKDSTPAEHRRRMLDELGRLGGVRGDAVVVVRSDTIAVYEPDALAPARHAQRKLGQAKAEHEQDAHAEHWDARTDVLADRVVALLEGAGITPGAIRKFRQRTGTTKRPRSQSRGLGASGTVRECPPASNSPTDRDPTIARHRDGVPTSPASPTRSNASPRTSNRAPRAKSPGRPR